MRAVSLAALLLAATGLRAPSTSDGSDAKLQETVRALDTDGNGKIDQSELEAFAKTQGLSSDEVLADFKELDVNHDGALDASEIGPLFEGANAAPDSAQATALTATSGTVQAAPPSAAAAAPPQAVAAGNILPPPNAVLVPAAASSLQAAATPALAATPATPAVQEQPSIQTQPQSSVGIDLVALQKEAQQQAGTVIASRLAQRAQQLLTRSAEDDKRAAAFEAEAKKLRDQAASLAQQAAAETKSAALTASSEISEKSKSALDLMTEAQQKTEAAAEVKRQEARNAMDKVRKAQSFLVKA